MDHLLARLAIDSLSVSKRIVDLLFKSFFPVNEPEKEWCCRCITLIQMNPMAARKFYQFAHKHTAATNITEFSQLLDCICSWGQVADILELVSDWLSESVPKQGDMASKSRKVQIQETVKAKPDLALSYLEFLFSHTSTREKVLGLGEGPLKQLHTLLGNWKLLHRRPKQSQSGDGAESLDVPRSPRCTCFFDASLQSFLMVCRDVFLVGLGDETFKGQILHLCSLVLLSEAGYLCIPAVLPMLKEVANSVVPDDNNQDQEIHGESTLVILGVVANIFQKIIELLARCLRKEPEEGQLVAQTWEAALLSGVYSTVFAAIIVEKRHLLQKVIFGRGLFIFGLRRPQQSRRAGGSSARLGGH
ncbi:hypothetical protein GOODEAATRI_000387 [Goodea atripinnis]|uniref:Uncharacterized protein n=1 Tax=Goodea atripinnis TaxID=208336 RepID=A0ABV0P0K1_9TELE